MNRIYQQSHSHYSYAYKSGAPWYFGEDLPLNHFQTICQLIEEAIIRKTILKELNDVD